MKRMVKYTKIIRAGNIDIENVIKKGEIISITEKMDGANASFTVDEDSKCGVNCYSRNLMLVGDNSLHGFRNWVHEEIVEKKDILNPNYRYFGEWMTKHKVEYKEEYKNRFFLFSIWDDNTRRYISDEDVIAEAMRIKIPTVTFFYLGEYISQDHILGYVGKSNKTAEEDHGEGVVVKNTSYRNEHYRQVFIKYYDEKFSEIKAHRIKQRYTNKETRPKMDAVLTKNRVEKMIYKTIDENIIKKSDIIIENMRNLILTLSPLLISDILEEEKEMFLDIEKKDFTKCFGKTFPSILREIVRDFDMEEN